MIEQHCVLGFGFPVKKSEIYQSIIDSYIPAVYCNIRKSLRRNTRIN